MSEITGPSAEAGVMVAPSPERYGSRKSSYPSGRGSRVRPAEAAAIRGAAIAGLSASAIARRSGRSKAAIGRVLNSDEMRAAREIAVSLLTAHVSDAPRHWIRASEVAAENGRHEAARDLLLATRAIQPIAKG